MSIQVRLGNEHPKQSRSRDENDRPIWEPSPGPSVCAVNIPDGVGMLEGITNIIASGGLWENQSFDKAPSWVSCEDAPEIANLISLEFGCPVGEPNDLEKTHHTFFGPPGVGPSSSKGKSK